VSFFYDRAGEPIDLERWAMLFEDKRYQIVKQTSVSGYLVSTVWIGFNQDLRDDMPPLIFETMVFAPERHASNFDAEQLRYVSEERAREDHERLVNEVQLLAQLMPDESEAKHRPSGR
jgi:hypothetical protein